MNSPRRRRLPRCLPRPAAPPAPARAARLAAATRAGVRASWRRARRRGLARLLGLLALAPLALLGALLNALPYQVVHRIARRVRDEPDQPAPFKVLPSLLPSPPVWAAEACGAGRVWGEPAGCAVALAGPLAGWVAVRFSERWGGLLRGVRAWLVLRRDPQRAAQLRATRESLRRDVLALERELMRNA